VRTVDRSAFVPYQADEMFRLVDDVDAYAQFLPWCSRSEVLSRTETEVEATLELSKGAIRKSFTTRNTLEPGRAINIELVGGPFRELCGGWQFKALDHAGSKVTLALKFEFESRILDSVFGAFFEDTCNSLVDAFTRRAADVYGDR
jgi:ribosome-associated toxin RatA of RatAB toxin-antitoxin module